MKNWHVPPDVSGAHGVIRPHTLPLLHALVASLAVRMRVVGSRLRQMRSEPGRRRLRIIEIQIYRVSDEKNWVWQAIARRYHTIHYASLSEHYDLDYSPYHLDRHALRIQRADFPTERLPYGS